MLGEQEAREAMKSVIGLHSNVTSSRSWRGSGGSQESNEEAMVVTLAMATAELVAESMQTRDLKAGQSRH